jgi:hypothetical protein
MGDRACTAFAGDQVLPESDRVVPEGSDRTYACYDYFFHILVRETTDLPVSMEIFIALLPCVAFSTCRALRHMTDLSNFDSNGPSNPKNNIFGLPFSEEDARLVILPVPWEVTVSYGAGTSRAPERVFHASMQVDLFDAETQDAWKKGIYMRQPDKKILMKSDYLRKEAELYINYTSKGEMVEKNSFMCKSLKEINEGSALLNRWVYEQTLSLLDDGKLVGLLGGDHSTPSAITKPSRRNTETLASCRSMRTATCASRMKILSTAMPASCTTPCRKSPD